MCVHSYYNNSTSRYRVAHIIIGRLVANIVVNNEFCMYMFNLMCWSFSFSLYTMELECFCDLSSIHVSHGSEYNNYLVYKIYDGLLISVYFSRILSVICILVKFCIDASLLSSIAT